MAEWIEIAKAWQIPCFGSSPLAMAEWIEIYKFETKLIDAAVSASDGGVD